MNPGETLSHYRVVALVGAGGMGEVYKAEDTRLKRPVALKVLTPALSDNPDAKQRLMAEAQAASALDHPNICTIHEIDETPDGRVFLAMAYYEGETLSKRIARGTVPLPEALDIVIQLARAVATAHDAGIIHRDIKPANIFLCSRASARSHDEPRSDTSVTARHHGDAGAVKLLDFGIAKLKDQTGLTRTGTTVGTAAYMSPEHIAGHAIDERADVWSIGVVLYELLGGVRPFNGENALAIMRSIADDRPRALSTVRSEVPPALDSIIERALQKRVGERYASAHDLLAELESLRSLMGESATAAVAHAASASRASRNKRSMAIGAAALVLLAAASLWFVTRSLRARQTQVMVDEIRTMVEHDRFYEALRRLRTLPPDVAGDRAVEKLRQDFFMPLSIRTDPPDADVYIKGYDEPKADWLHLGRTPIDTRGQRGAYRWRVVKAGFETFEGASGPQAFGDVAFTLAPNGTTPEDEVHAPGAELPANGGRVPDFGIDRFELTNKAFKRFVEAGGYRSPTHWQHPFVKEGRTLTWEQAMAEFRDTTGRPGPSTWELGTYPNGQDDWPVSGVSWYEAAAYAHFAGRSLPTVHHWRLAAQMSIFSEILEWSNFSGKGPARVGQFLGIGPIGTYDMAGNVKEWCVNEVGDRRYIMGGGWNEPNYQYRNPDARLPFDRSSNNGIRLVTIADPSAVPEAAYAPVPQLARNYAAEKPVTDEVFAAYRRLYSYDRGDLGARVESTSDESDLWRVERVSYNAAYGGERVPAYLFLPKNSKPPYQTVLYFPHSGGTLINSFQQAEMAYLGFLVKAGHALLFPMYKGMYERREKDPGGPNALRDLVIQQVKDVSRSIDYLQTRPDIAHDKLAFFGVSLGGNRASIVLAVESRFNTAILWSGGLPLGAYPPEVDPVNFAPRVKTPLLMLNGRDDFTFPIETSQEPLFRLLGTPAADKVRGLYDGGHVFPFSRMIKDSLDWLDRYLGVPQQP